jgi:hypothetical protein
VRIIDDVWTAALDRESEQRANADPLSDQADRQQSGQLS